MLLRKQAGVRGSARENQRFQGIRNLGLVIWLSRWILRSSPRFPAIAEMVKGYKPKEQIETYCRQDGILIPTSITNVVKEFLVLLLSNFPYMAFVGPSNTANKIY